MLQNLSFPIDVELLTNADTWLNQEERHTLGDTYDFIEPNASRQLIILEKLFGSGMHVAQTSELAILEFLIILNSFQQQQKTEEPTYDDGVISYTANKQMLLRALLFNNFALEHFNNSSYTEDYKWNAWISYFQETNKKADYVSSIVYKLQQKQKLTQEEQVKLAEHLNSSQKLVFKNTAFSTEELRTLQSKFHSFSEFTASVKLLQKFVVFETESKSSFYNKFIFPLSADALFVEINTDNTVKQNMMSGVGSIIFNMIRRTPLYKEVFNSIFIRFFEQKDQLSHILNLLSTASTETQYQTSTKYLPLKEHPCYQQLAQDFLTLLDLDLSREELFYELSRIAYLNLLVYYIGRMATICNNHFHPCDFAFFVNANNLPQSKNQAIYETSQICLVRNENLLKESVWLYVQSRLNSFLYNTDASLLRDYLTEEQCTQLCKILPYAFNSNITQQLKQNSLKDISLEPFPFTFCEHIDHELSQIHQCKLVRFDSIINEVTEKTLAMSKYKYCHQKYATVIGLKSSNTRSKNYSISDELLNTLAMVIISKKDKYMPLNSFLQELKQRYHILIDNIDFLRDVNISKEQLNVNRNNFIEQLKRTKLLVKLSDNSNSYVRNPRV